MQKDKDKKTLAEENDKKEEEQEEHQNENKDDKKQEKEGNTKEQGEQKTDYDKFDESDKFVDVHEDAARKGATNFYKTKAERDIDEKYQKKQDEIDKRREEIKKKQAELAVKSFLGLNNGERGSFLQKSLESSSNQKQQMAQRISQDAQQSRSQQKHNPLVDQEYDERMAKAVAEAYQKEAQMAQELGIKLKGANDQSRQEDNEKNKNLEDTLKELDDKEKELSNDKKKEINKLKQKDEKKRKQTVEGGSGGFIPIENIDGANENITPPSQVGGEKNKQTGLSC